MSIIWLFAFQNLYGYVYQRIGWIIAMFMGGLVIGCWWMGRRAKRAQASASELSSKKPDGRTSRLSVYLWQRLVAIDLLIALSALGVTTCTTAPPVRSTFAFTEASSRSMEE